MSKKNSRPTPYSDKYPSCERTCSKLIIYPGEITPSLMKKYLKIEPSWVSTKGELRTSSHDRIRTSKFNVWGLTSENKIDSLDLRRHLDWLLDKIEPCAQEIKALQDHESVQMVVVCIWWSKYGNGGPVLWPEQMLRLANLNLECSFDIYFFGDDDDGDDN
jgi:hypothetical protein